MSRQPVEITATPTLSQCKIMTWIKKHTLYKRKNLIPKQGNGCKLAKKWLNGLCWVMTTTRFAYLLQTATIYQTI